MDLAILCCRLLHLDLKEVLKSNDLSCDSSSSAQPTSHNYQCRAVDVPPVDSAALVGSYPIHYIQDYEPSETVKKFGEAPNPSDCPHWRMSLVSESMRAKREALRDNPNIQHLYGLDF